MDIFFKHACIHLRVIKLICLMVTEMSLKYNYLYSYFVFAIFHINFVGVILKFSSIRGPFHFIRRLQFKCPVNNVLHDI